MNDAITVLVKYGNQLKPINVTQKDDLPSIECKIYDRFKFNTEQRNNSQIQWYDDDFKEFIDLDSETWLKYVKNEQYWKNNIHSDSQKHLKLVDKKLHEQYNGAEGLFKRIFPKKKMIVFRKRKFLKYVNLSVQK